MIEDAVLDPTIHEPPLAAAEVDTLLFAPDRSRFTWRRGGLDTAGRGGR
jgi:hypothetical protein